MTRWIWSHHIKLGLLLAAMTAADLAAGTPAAMKKASPRSADRVVPVNAQQPAEPLKAIRQLVDQSLAYYAQHQKYTCRIIRQERIGGKLLPTEIMMMHYQTQPRGVYFQWFDESNAGRECVFVEGKNDGKIISQGGKSDFLFVGKRLPPVDPFGWFARSKSRHPITESGLDMQVMKLVKVVAEQEKGNVAAGKTTYLGKTVIEEASQEVIDILQEVPTGVDGNFPLGGRRHWYFGFDTSELIKVVAEDPQGELLENYVFDRFIPNDLLDESDFDVDRLGPGAERLPERNAQLEVQPPK